MRDKKLLMKVSLTTNENLLELSQTAVKFHSDAMRNELEPEQPPKKNTRQAKIYHAHRDDP